MADKLRFWALLGATYALLLITLGFQLYEDASIPPLGTGPEVPLLLFKRRISADCSTSTLLDPMVVSALD